jgi:hypothetical protein
MRNFVMLGLCLVVTSCGGAGADRPGSGDEDSAAGGGPGTDDTGGGHTGSGGDNGGGDSGGGDNGAGAAGGSSGSGMPQPCPAGVVCVTSFPFSHTSTTTGAASDQLDLYSCSTANESGPELVYRIDVPSDGFLFLNLPESDMAPGVDVDVHLLGSLDANDCLDRGHWSVGELVTAGQYYVTVDTFVSSGGDSADGAYTLEVGLTTVDDLTGWGMSASVASDALHAFDEAWSKGEVETAAFAVVDFALHASKPRMWVFDVFETSLQQLTYTTVGEASDPDGDGWADVFSNVPGSNQSSLGLMKGAELYTGTYGASMRMDGLEPGYNDNVRSRAIVLHPWTGSTDDYVSAFPSSGAAPTWGCLGIDPDIVEDVRTFLADGGLLLSHFPDGGWSASSSYLP